MPDLNMAILKSLVIVAWADGEFDAREREMIEALTTAFQATDEQTKEIRAYAAEKKSFNDIPADELGADDCRVLLQQAVLLTYVDGVQRESEKQTIDDLCTKLGLPQDQAKELIGYAEARAKRFLNLL